MKKFEEFCTHIDCSSLAVHKRWVIHDPEILQILDDMKMEDGETDESYKRIGWGFAKIFNFVYEINEKSEKSLEK